MSIGVSWCIWGEVALRGGREDILHVYTSCLAVTGDDIQKANVLPPGGRHPNVRTAILPN